MFDTFLTLFAREKSIFHRQILKLVKKVQPYSQSVRSIKSLFGNKIWTVENDKKAPLKSPPKKLFLSVAWTKFNIWGGGRSIQI